MTGSHMGLHDKKREDYASCLREKARSGALPKGSVVNAHRLSEICGGDPRTADSHLPGLIGLELEGLNYSGKLRNLNIEAGPWAIVDPPSDAWMDKRAPAKRGASANWIALGTGLLIGGIVLATVSLASLAVWQRQDHQHSWSPMVGSESGILVCRTCGGHVRNLNDQSAPFHFTPANC